MCIAEMKEINRPYLTVEEIAVTMRVGPQSIRNQAREDDSKLGFPVCQVGSKILIPRVAYLKFLGEEVA